MESVLRDHVSDESFALSFYGEDGNKIWQQIEGVIGKEKTEEFRGDIAALRPDFTAYWRIESENLHAWQEYFQSNQSLFQRTVSEIEIVCGAGNFAIAKTPIYLISDPKASGSEVRAWFSWKPEGGFVVVEIPKSLKVANDLFPIAVLAHEFFHLILRRNKELLAAIAKLAEENEELIGQLSGVTLSRMFLEELLVSSFIPEGYLNEKYFGGKVVPCTYKPKDLLDWRKLISFKLRSAAKRYVDNAQQIDKEYLEHVMGAIRQNSK